MCINHDSLRTVLPPPCHPNAGWRHVNHGATTSRRTTTVVACTRCDLEWSAHLDLEPVTPAAEGKPGAAPKRPVEIIEAGYRVAEELVIGGMTIKAACGVAGIETAQYYRRRNGTVKRRTA
jgi:hypothetical protein